MKAQIQLKQKTKRFLCEKLCRDDEKTCALWSPMGRRDVEPPNDVKKARKKRQK